MNADRMTQRVQEALNAAYSLALAEHNPQTTPEHLLVAILDQDGGIAAPLLERAGADPKRVRAAAQAAVAALPRLSGPNADQAQVTVAPALSRLLVEADDTAKQLNDDYVSVEHLLLAMIDAGGSVSRVLRESGLSREKLLAALKDVRGNQRVTNQNPEATYQSLERYGRDLTRDAEKGKLDPVIGRDDEIRRVVQVLVAPHEEQPGADRRARRRQDRDRRRARAAHRARRRPRRAEGQADRLARHGRADRRREVSRRVRRAAEGGPQGRASSPRAACCCSSTRCTTSSAPARPRVRWTPATCSSRCSRAANCT